MTVLVTRPGPQGQELCQLIMDAGIPAIQHPLIEIQPAVNPCEPLDHLTSYDIILAVSQHAVTFADKILSARQKFWPQGSVYLAVGQKTAHYLSKASQQHVNYPATSNSEHCLALPELQNVTDKRIVILRGNGGRELIKDTLEYRGAKVSYCETYYRQRLKFDAQDRVNSWHQQHVSTLIVTSAEQLEWLFLQFSPEQLAWAQRLKVLVPSDRIADTAHNFGCEQVVTVGSAANHDLLAALHT